MKLEINHLTKNYGTHHAISSMNLDLPECQTLVFIGPSGGGKSTLLRLIAGLVIPDSGWIALNGSKIDFKEAALRQHRRSLGIVFQSWNLFPHLTALENIVLPLHRVQNLTQEEAEARSFELLKRFELDLHAHKKPFALSGGQVQRIALIRAVAVQPKMLMLDEPTSALDPLMTSEVLELILELKKEKRDLIFVTHHLHFAKKIADWVLFISEGKIIESGPSSVIFDSPATPQVQQYMAKVLSN
jgi:polar amino acid transport system ATP-binding protein